MYDFEYVPRHAPREENMQILSLQYSPMQGTIRLYSFCLVSMEREREREEDDFLKLLKPSIISHTGYELSLIVFKVQWRDRESE